MFAPVQQPVDSGNRGFGPRAKQLVRGKQRFMRFPADHIGLDAAVRQPADKRGQTVQARLDTAERCFPGGLIHDVFPIPSEDGWRTIGMRAPSVNGATRALRRLTLTTGLDNVRPRWLSESARPRSLVRER